MGRIIETILDTQKTGAGGIELGRLRNLAKTSTLSIAKGRVGAEDRDDETELEDDADEDRSSRGTAKRGSGDALGAMLERRWGPQFRDPEATLARLRELPPVSLIGERLSEWLISQSRVPGITPDRWRQAQTFCVLADTYLPDLIAYRARLPRSSPERAALQEAMFALVHPDSFHLAANSRRVGAGLLSVGLHSGATRFARWIINKCILGGDIFVIGAAGEGNARQFATVRKEPARALMLLIRHLKQPGNLATMMIDGQYTNSYRKVDLLGRPVAVAYGAPHAIYHSKCQNRFAINGWVDRKLVFHRTEGPVPDPGEPLAQWTERWFDALKSFLESHVTGDPMHIRGYSGLWTQLAGRGRHRD